MWFMFMLIGASANPTQDAWAARDGAALRALCRTEQSGEACFLEARTHKLALEDALAARGQEWVLDDPVEPLPRELRPLGRQIASAYAHVAQVAPRSRYADDGLAMAAGLEVRTGAAQAGWRDALAAREVGNGDAMSDAELARFALYVVIEQQPGGGIDPWSPVPLLRAHPRAVEAVVALLRQAGLQPSWREISLNALEYAEPTDVQALLARHRGLIGYRELAPVLARAYQAPLAEPPRRGDLALYRRHYAQQRQAGAGPSACSTQRLPARSAACVAEASVEVHLALEAGRVDTARERLSQVQRHPWADRLGVDIEALATVLDDLQRAADPAATERELRRLADSVNAKRLLRASAGGLPRDVDPNGLRGRVLDRAVKQARPQVLAAMVNGEFTTFGDFVRTPLATQLLGHVDPRRTRPRVVYPRWQGLSDSEAAHWLLTFDAVRAEGLAQALQHGPAAYERHIRRQVPGLLEGGVTPRRSTGLYPF